MEPYYPIDSVESATPQFRVSSVKLTQPDSGSGEKLRGIPTDVGLGKKSGRVLNKEAVASSDGFTFGKELLSRERYPEEIVTEEFEYLLENEIALRVDDFPDLDGDLRLDCESGYSHIDCFGERLPICNAYCQQGCHVACGHLFGPIRSMMGCLAKHGLASCAYNFIETREIEVRGCRRVRKLHSSMKSSLAYGATGTSTVYLFEVPDQRFPDLDFKHTQKAVLVFEIAGEDFNWRESRVPDFGQLMSSVTNVNIDDCGIPPEANQYTQSRTPFGNLLSNNVPTGYYIRRIIHKGKFTGNVQVELDVTNLFRSYSLQSLARMPQIMVWWPNVQPELVSGKKQFIKIRIQAGEDQYLSESGVEFMKSNPLHFFNLRH